jgi:hypothetical protein
MVPSLSMAQQVWLAFLAFFRVLFNRTFAEGVWAVYHGELKALPPGKEAPRELPAAEPEKQAPEPTREPERDPGTAAVQLLAVLQRDGRLVDFLMEDLGDAPDADLAAVVRSTVYSGCRKALQSHFKLVPVSEQAEGAPFTVEAGFNPASVRLSGNVVGNPPFRGTLKHRGWKVVEVNLPEPAKGSDGKIVAPAEVELA